MIISLSLVPSSPFIAFSEFLLWLIFIFRSNWFLWKVAAGAMRVYSDTKGRKFYVQNMGPLSDERISKTNI